MIEVREASPQVGEGGRVDVIEKVGAAPCDALPGIDRQQHGRHSTVREEGGSQQTAPDREGRRAVEQGLARADTPNVARPKGPPQGQVSDQKKKEEKGVVDGRLEDQGEGNPRREGRKDSRFRDPDLDRQKRQRDPPRVEKLSVTEVTVAPRHEAEEHSSQPGRKNPAPDPPEVSVEEQSGQKERREYRRVVEEKRPAEQSKRGEWPRNRQQVFRE